MSIRGVHLVFIAEERGVRDISGISRYEFIA